MSGLFQTITYSLKIRAGWSSNEKRQITHGLKKKQKSMCLRDQLKPDLRTYCIHAV